MKECIKNLDIAFEYMYKSLVLRGSTKKHLKLLKMPAKRKRRYQIKLLRNVKDRINNEIFLINIFIDSHHCVHLIQS